MYLKCVPGGDLLKNNFLHRVGPMIGLLLIALGTGGIKPCVSAFGGDQFNANQVCAVSDLSLQDVLSTNN